MRFALCGWMMEDGWIATLNGLPVPRKRKLWFYTEVGIAVQLDAAEYGQIPG